MTKIRTNDGRTIEAITGTYICYETIHGDTAVFAKTEIGDQATQEEMRKHGTTTIQAEWQGVGIRYEGDRHFQSVYATIEEAREDILEGHH